MKKVNVKVQYFDIIADGKVFDLREWITEEQYNIDNKEIIIFHKNDKIIIEEMDSSIPGIWAFRIQKLREDGYPKKIKAHGVSSDIDLKDDEYLGEDTTFLYDTNSKRLMMQINRFSILPTKFEALLNHTYSGNRQILLAPISNKRAKEMLKSPVRKLRFAVSLPELKKDTALNDMISGLVGDFDEFMPNVVKIELNMGYEKNVFLAKSKTKKLIDELIENKGTVLSAEAHVQNDYDNDLKILPIDLFKTVQFDYLTFVQEEKSKSIGFEFMRDEMYRKFSGRKL